MGRDLLVDAHKPAMAFEVAPEIVAFKPGPAIPADEKRRIVVGPRLQISLDPSECPVGKENSALFLSFADNLGLPPQQDVEVLFTVCMSSLRPLLR